MSEANWVRATVHHRITDDSVFPARSSTTEVYGYLSGNIAIYNTGLQTCKFKIVHHPSGKGIDTAQRLVDAKQLVADLRKEFGDVTQLFNRGADNILTETEIKKMRRIKRWLKQRERRLHEGN